MRILVVDDDLAVREALCAVFEEEGFIVETAENGRVGLERLKRQPLPDVILLDLMMPVLNGWDFLAELRRDLRLKKLPVVVFSATHELPDIEGVEAVIHKPVALGALLDTVYRYCA